MHKYQPRIHVVRSNDIRSMKVENWTTVIFRETEFIAVETYQNKQARKGSNGEGKGYTEERGIKRKGDKCSDFGALHLPNASLSPLSPFPYLGRKGNFAVIIRLERERREG